MSVSLIKETVLQLFRMYLISTKRFARFPVENGAGEIGNGVQNGYEMGERQKLAIFISIVQRAHALEKNQQQGRTRLLVRRFAVDFLIYSSLSLLSLHRCAEVRTCVYHSFLGPRIRKRDNEHVCSSEEQKVKNREFGELEFHPLKKIENRVRLLYKYPWRNLFPHFRSLFIEPAPGWTMSCREKET
jgi:hypothetical protein